jgi:hypothetical protein
MYLLPETIAYENGSGAEVALDDERGKTLLLTLGINRIVEQGSLEVVICGSGDQKHWDELAAFPRKSHCGTYALVLDLARLPAVRYLRADWKMSRWGHGKDPAPLFGFYVLAESAKPRAAGVA